MMVEERKGLKDSFEFGCFGFLVVMIIIGLGGGVG